MNIKTISLTVFLSYTVLAQSETFKLDVEQEQDLNNGAFDVLLEQIIYNESFQWNCKTQIKTKKKSKKFPIVLLLKLTHSTDCNSQWNTEVNSCSNNNNTPWYCPIVKEIQDQRLTPQNASNILYKKTNESFIPRLKSVKTDIENNETEIEKIKAKINPLIKQNIQIEFKQKYACKDCYSDSFVKNIDDSISQIKKYQPNNNSNNQNQSIINKIIAIFCHYTNDQIENYTNGYEFKYIEQTPTLNEQEIITAKTQFCQGER